MSLDLATAITQLKTLVATDKELAAIRFLTQIAGDDDEQLEADAYNTELEKALREDGLALVAVAAEGVPASDETRPMLDLWNTVVLSIVENTKKNQSGQTCYQLMRRALRVCHRGQTSPVRGARAEMKLSSPAYNLGPMGGGNVVYFVNLLIRTTEDLGPITPA